VTQSEDRVRAVREMGGLFLGPQGDCLLLEQKFASLPSGYSFTSFDQNDYLFRTEAQGRHVPTIEPLMVGDRPTKTLFFTFRRFDTVWNERSAFLVYTLL
jgi:hypothetical protein